MEEKSDMLPVICVKSVKFVNVFVLLSEMN